MTRQLSNQTQQQTSTTSPLSSGILQRKCVSCGQHTIAGGECEGCQKKRSSLQRRAINGENIFDVPPLDSYPFRKSCFHHDFSHIPVHTAAPVLIQPKLTISTVGGRYEQEADHIANQVMSVPASTTQQTPRKEELVQTRLKISEPGDRYEKEADHIADKVMQMSDPSVQWQVESGEKEEEEDMVQRKATGGQITSLVQRQVLSEIEDEREKNLVQRKEINTQSPIQRSSIIHEVLNSPGQPLNTETRTFMESRFGEDFSQVRVHTDNKAIQLSQMLNAQAFTYRQDIYFGAGKFPGKNALTAHELTHVLQQTRGHHNQTQPQKSSDSVKEPVIQRVVEVRPPGRGEASAFDRRQELIDRLNTLSAAIQYRLDGRRIAYNVIDEAALTHFDRKMQGFIDRAEVIPMRLITSAGRLVAGGASFPVIADSFVTGYVDLDDLLATDSLGFQSILIHFLTERFSVPDYERLIGTAALGTQFNRAHTAGHEAQVQHFQSVFNDPSIRFNYEEIKPNGSAHIVFRSRDGGYRIFLIVHRIRGAVSGSEVRVRTTADGWLTVEEFLRRRAAAVPALP